jgi:PAS domain S-box-containing protein
MKGLDEVVYRILIAAPESERERKLRAALASRPDCVIEIEAARTAEELASVPGGRFDALIVDPSLGDAQRLAHLREARRGGMGSVPLFFLGDRAEDGLAGGDSIVFQESGPDLTGVWKALEASIGPDGRDPWLTSIEQQLGDLAWHFYDGLVVYDIGMGRVVYASPAFENIWRVRRTAVAREGEAWISTFVPEDRDRVRKAMEKAVEWGAQALECRIQRPDGAIRWIALRVAPWRDEGGRVRRLSAVATDITRHKETEAALRMEKERHREHEQRYRLLFENSPLPMFLYDFETLAYLEVNDAAVAKYGYSREEFLQMTVLDIRPEEDRVRFKEALRTLGSGVQHLGDWRHRLKDGRLIDVELLTETIVVEEGRKAVLVTAIDVTEQRRTKRREECEREVTAILAEAETVREAVPRVLRAVGERLGFEYVAGWSAPGRGDGFGCAYFWSSGGFPAVDPYTALTPHDPLLQKAVATREPVWVTDFLREPEYARRLVAMGLRSGAMLPVSAGASDWAAMGVFCTNCRALDEGLRRLLESVAARLGQFIERKRAEETKRNHDERTRLIMENALDAVIETDADGRVTRWNAQAERIFGWGREEVLGRPLTETIIPPEAALPHAEGIARFLETGAGPMLNRRVEVAALRRDGTRFPIELSITAVQTGGNWSFNAFVRDISERKAAEERLRSQTALLESILRHIGDGVLVADRSGRLLLVNEAAERLCGLPVEREAGPRARRMGLYHPDRKTPLREEELPSCRAARGENVDDMEIYLSNEAHPEGRWLLCNARPVSIDGGDPVAGVVVLRDNTLRKSGEEAMRAAMEAAESANRTKSEFLANVSHELRTPLNGILGMLELALSSELTPEQREFLNLARAAAENQLAVVNDILDFAKIESGRFEIRPSAFDLREQVKTSLGTLAVRAARKGLEFSIDVDPDLPSTLLGDPVRLRQVLLNLVGNAVKFTDKGFIRVHAAVESKGSDGVVLGFSVKDTGIGIPAGKLQLIFEPFAQADGSLTRRYAGTGLGLTIAAELVKRMGGAIRVESEEGKGSCFRFTAKFGLVSEHEAASAATPARAPAAPVWTSRPLRVLLAEDNPVNQRLIVRLLEAEGHRVVTASDGRAAFEAYANGTAPFDVALVDLQMPGLDGFGLTASIRQHERVLGRHLPIVALTAHATGDYRERCLAAGMDDYLAKPFQARQLLEAIGRVLLGQASGR